ncbi:M56 family metallopeptidase [Paenibacillus peoriae]|uniref:M56 family metallopeptidase n=1 Tax=Paenibacillus peoriae TaxID=59893 RepID=UPI00026C647C|nr:M56 family metallopeptidase [Paenibacillus peoriae]MEC0182612.1 M56 family metallopeptidase [Paenibacillus peoriae]
MSVSASILIFFIIVTRILALNRLPKTMFLLLWGIAICKLMLPFTVPSRLSIYNIFPAISLFLTQGREKSGIGKFTSDSQFEYSNSTINQLSTRTPFSGTSLMLLWITGVALLVIFFAVIFYKNLKEMRTAVPVKGNDQIDKWLTKENASRPIQILVSDRISSPLVYGIFFPKIILPKSLDFNNKIQMKHILTHELVHIKRFDNLKKFMLVLVLCFHWFNPVVWVLYVLANRDIELACDEKVLKLLGNDVRSAYALSLINMAEQRKKFIPFYNGFSRNAAEERIVSIMKFKKTSMISMATALILVFGGTSVFATSADVVEVDPSNVTVIDTSDVSTNFAGSYSINPSKANNVTANLGSDETEFATVTGESVVDKTPAVTISEANIVKDSTSVKAAVASITIKGYQYTSYGSIPLALNATATYQGYTYTGTLYLESFTYDKTTDKYVGSYSGTLYR